MQALTNILAEGVSTVHVESRVELARWSAGNALLIGGLISAVGLYAVWWMYRREARGNLSKLMRSTLATCRVAVLVLLGVIGLEPIFVKYEHRRLDAQTLVLVDESASMSLSDHYRDANEAKRVMNAIGMIPEAGAQRESIGRQLLSPDGAAMLKKLADRNDVKLFTFSDSLKFQEMIPRVESYATNAQDESAASPVSSSSPSSSSSSPSSRGFPAGMGANGSATDVGIAIRGALDAAAGAPIAGVVVLTDGGFNHGEAPGIVSRLLSQRQLPVFAVGIGDPAEPVNARVTHVSAPRSAFKNDPFSITVRVEASNSSAENLKVELYEAIDGGQREGVESRVIKADASGRFSPLVFERKVKKPGMVRYAARIAPLSFEAVTSDNEKELSPGVRILDDQMKVLLIAGAPSYDYRFLARLFERDQTVELSTWLQSADSKAVRDGNKVITALPTTLEEINKYDAIIIMDCDPSELDPTWASIVSTYVSDNGGGLLYAAGNKFTGRFLKSENLKSLVDVLPIAADPEAELVINELGHYQTRPWPIFVPEDATGDPILRQGDDPSQTAPIWSTLGNVYWHYPVRREKPVARVLMRHTNPKMANSFGQHVLFATQYVGTGRTAWLGINSTWRWRRSSERHFNRFWIQTVRFLVEGKLLGGRARGQVLTPKDEYEQGETVVATVRALDEQFNPLLVPELDLSIHWGVPKSGEEKNARKDTIELAPIIGRDGYYEGRFVAREVGPARLVVQLPGMVGREDAEADRTIEKEIDVSQADIEMRNTAMNRSGLKELVAGVGGRSRYLEVDEAGSLPSLIPDMRRTFTVRGRPRPLWDNGTVLGVIVGLLTIEWILRKKARLL